MSKHYTDLELVEKYLEFKHFLAQQKDAYETAIKPYVDGMTVIENEFLRRLTERGADNTKTDAGTGLSLNSKTKNDSRK